MSVSNNIAEGSGASSKKDFKNFLNFARRSAFENANILIILERRGLIDTLELDKKLTDLSILSRQIYFLTKDPCHQPHAPCQTPYAYSLLCPFQTAGP
jgi:four helix bundle protein